MHSALNAIFEADTEMQDLVDDMDDGLADNSDELIIGSIEDRMADTNAHLFTDKTQEEIEHDKNVDDLLDDSVSDEEMEADMDDLLDDDDF